MVIKLNYYKYMNNDNVIGIYFSNSILFTSSYIYLLLLLFIFTSTFSSIHFFSYLLILSNPSKTIIIICTIFVTCKFLIIFQMTLSFISFNLLSFDSFHLTFIYLITLVFHFLSLFLLTNNLFTSIKY